MYEKMAMIMIFILSSTLLGTVKGYSCFDNRITCIDMTAPKFRYRVNINILYMEHVQILDFESIIKNLPNLDYLTMMNMRFFRCEWLKIIPLGINLYTNMCVSYSNSETTAPSESTTATVSDSSTAASYWTSTGEFFLTFCIFLCPFGVQNILLYFFYFF